MRTSDRLIRAAAAACLALLCAGVLSACGGAADASATGTATDSTSTRDAGALSATSSSDGAAPASAARLFVPDLAHPAISALPVPDPGAALAGVTLRTRGPNGNNVQVDAARDELYAIAGRCITVVAGASTATSASVPARSFPLPASMRRARTLFLDAANDVLYVGGDGADGAGEIVAWSGAHLLQGAATSPTRVMLIDGGVAFFTIDVLRERLYVVNALSGVQVFASVDTASGALLPVSTIAVVGTGLAIDSARDRLYVADAFAGLMLVDQASTGAPVITAALAIDDARFVAVDPAADRAYVSAGGALYVIDNASALTSATTLAAPSRARAANASLGAVATR
jgi:hypothetical protein